MFHPFLRAKSRSGRGAVRSLFSPISRCRKAVRPAGGWEQSGRSLPPIPRNAVFTIFVPRFSFPCASAASQSRRGSPAKVRPMPSLDSAAILPRAGVYSRLGALPKAFPWDRFLSAPFAFQLFLFFLLPLHPDVNGGDDERPLLPIQSQKLGRRQVQLMEAVISDICFPIAVLNQFFASSTSS